LKGARTTVAVVAAPSIEIETTNAVFTGASLLWCEPIICSLPNKPAADA
jgi:hypothetical protein